MRLLFPFAALVMIGSPVHASDSISFVIGGHRVHIEAPRHCNSVSCVSVSIPGIYEKRGRDRSDDDARNATGSAAPARPIASAAPQVVPLQPQIPPSPVLPQKTTAIVPPPPAPPVSTPPADVARPVACTALRISKVSHEVDEQPDETPIGDWETQGRKGMVRIEPCGQALCGYVLRRRRPRARRCWST